jgi:hypothetical protein
MYMQDCCLGFIPYCFSNISEKWSINSYFTWDLNSADTCLVACISVGVSGGRSSKIIGCGSGAVDVLSSAEPWVFEWPITGGACTIGWLADRAGCYVYNWLEIANWFRSVCNNCAESTYGTTGYPVAPWLIGYWGDDLVWATVLARVKTACIIVDCWTGVVCMGIPMLVAVVE